MRLRFQREEIDRYQSPQILWWHRKCFGTYPMHYSQRKRGLAIFYHSRDWTCKSNLGPSACMIFLQKTSESEFHRPGSSLSRNYLDRGFQPTNFSHRIGITAHVLAKSLAKMGHAADTQEISTAWRGRCHRRHKNWPDDRQGGMSSITIFIPPA
jgi:hypothetical protein